MNLRNKYLNVLDGLSKKKDVNQTILNKIIQIKELIVELNDILKGEKIL